MNNLLDSFASAMRSARIKRGLTQRALAERLNMSVRTIIEIERCRSSPKFETVMLLARELNVSLDAIVFRTYPQVMSQRALLISLQERVNLKFRSILPYASKLKHCKERTNAVRQICPAALCFVYSGWAII